MWPYKNALLDYMVCVLPVFYFPVWIPDFYSESRLICAKFSMLISKWTTFYSVFIVWVLTRGNFPTHPSLGGGGGGVVLRAWSELHRTSGRFGLRCMRLCRCEQTYFGAIHLLYQAQPWTWLPLWLPGLQGTWYPSSAKHLGVRLCDRDYDPAINPNFNMQNGLFHFFGHGLTQSSKYDLVLLTHHPIKQEDKWRKMFPLVVEVPPMLVLLHILPPRQRIIHSFCLTGIHVRI